MNTKLDPYLADVAASTVQNHLAELGGSEPDNLYRKVIDEAERGMLGAMMEHTRGNQCKAAQALGINRSTLNIRLKRHNLL